MRRVLAACLALACSLILVGLFAGGLASPTVAAPKPATELPPPAQTAHAAHCGNPAHPCPTNTATPTNSPTASPTHTATPTNTPTATPTCVPVTPIAIVTPAFTPGPGCSSTPPPGTLTAVITDHPTFTEALFTNNSFTCSYPIGLAVYRMVDPNLADSSLYDYRAAVIPPNSTLTLTVNKPSCAYQAYAFYGPLIVSFAGGERYNERDLADTASNGTPYCSCTLGP